MDKALSKFSSSYSKMNEAVEEFSTKPEADEAPLADIEKWFEKIKDEAKKLGLEFFILAKDGDVGATNYLSYVGRKGTDPVKGVVKSFKEWKKKNAYDIGDEEPEQQPQQTQEPQKSE